MWKSIENGRTIGSMGSEDGVIVRDEEFEDGMRITLEQKCRNALWSITCGIYGWMFHTRYFSTDPIEDFLAMQDGLSTIFAMIPLVDDLEVKAKSNKVSKAISDFVERFP